VSAAASLDGGLDVAVTKRLGTFELRASFVTSGRVTALFGPSGAGKTSLAGTIAGLVRPDAGHVRVGGTPLFDASAGIDVPPEQRAIGYVFQDARLFPHFDVERNLRFGLRRAGARPPVAHFDDVVDLLDLRAHLRRRPGTLSGGERQRVALGRALLAQPRLLILDEPLASLDASRRAEILPYLERMRDRTAVPMVLVSHQIEEVIRLAIDVVLIEAGRVVATGPVEAIFSRGDLRAHTGRRFEGGAVVEARVKAHHPEWTLTEVTVGAASLTVPAIDAPAGSRLRLRIRARDVALALAEPMETSIGSRIPGRVTEVTTRDGPYAEVRVDIGGVALWALVTRMSAVRLRLAPGTPVWCLVKTVALDNRMVAPAPASGDAISPREVDSPGEAS
jgi:molybdate transport system ATP-binding protein